MISSILEKGTPEDYEKELRGNLEKDIADEIKSQNNIIEIHSAELQKRRSSLWIYLFGLFALIYMAIYQIVSSGSILVRLPMAIFLFLLSYSCCKILILPIIKKNQIDRKSINNALSNLERSEEICEERIKKNIEIYRRIYNKWANYHDNGDTNIYTKNLNLGSGKIITHDESVNYYYFSIDDFINSAYSDEKTLSDILYYIKESNIKLSQLEEILEK